MKLLRSKFASWAKAKWWVAWTEAKRRAVEILIYGEPDILVLFMGAGAVFWGIFLALPLGTFQTAPTYELMRAYAPAHVWGLSLIAAGLTKLYTLFFTDCSWIKVIVNFCFFIIWTFVAVSFIIASPAGTSTAVYPFFALASLWLTVRRAQQMLGGR